MRRYQLSRTLFFYVLISLFTAPLVSQKPEPHFSVVTLLVEFPDGYESLGTGTFVDHDGLILTADHVVHNTTVKSSSIAQGPIPPQIQPSKITIYNKRLGFQWTVDLSQADSVVGGAISSTRWVDLALIRVKLSDTERLVVQPLAISIDLPVQGSPLSAWGPACKDPKDSACLKVNTIPANLEPVMKFEPS